MKRKVLGMCMVLMTAACSVCVQAGSETVEEQVLLDENGVKITAKELDTDGWMGPELKILIENNTDTNLTVQTRYASVNGYMIDSLISSDVAAGKKANDEITFSNTDLKRCGIETIADMEFSFHIFNSESWDTVLDTDQIQVYTSAKEGYTYSFEDGGEVIYEDGNVRIVNKNILEEDSFMGTDLLLYIENTSDQGIVVQARDASVNGFMVTPLISEEIAAGKCSIAGMTIMQSELEENGIDVIEDVELSFHIADMNFWDTLADTPVVVLHF